MRLLSRLWVEKYEIVTVVLGLYFLVAMPAPHNFYLAGIAIGKVVQIYAKVDRLIPNIFFDAALGIYLLVLGHPFLGAFAFLVGRLRDFMFGVKPGEEYNDEYWRGDRHREEASQPRASPEPVPPTAEKGAMRRNQK